MQHQHLAGGVAAGADADGGAACELGSQAGGHGGRHHFKHQHGGACVLQLVRLPAQQRGGVVATALHAVAAQRVHGLRCQPQVGADRNPALDQKAHGLGGPTAAFELDHVRTGLHQHAGAAQGLFAGLLVGAEGQVADQPGHSLRAAQAVGHAFGVVPHGFQRHAHRAAQALADHAQRVTDQNAFDARGIGHSGEGRVIGGQHGDLFALLAHVAQARQADGLALRRHRSRRQRTVGRGRVVCRGVSEVLNHGWLPVAQSLISFGRVLIRLAQRLLGRFAWFVRGAATSAKLMRNL